MYKKISVPENELEDAITELLEYCDVKFEEGELGKTKFSSPVSEEEIEAWEKENGVKIPELYKQWLRFTGDCIIDGTTAEFYSPKNFRTEYVPEDLVIIGEQIGDGEVVCFSKETGDIVSFFEGSVNYEYGSFGRTLKEVIRLMGKPEEENDEDKEESELERLKRERRNVLEYLEESPKDRELCLEIIDELDEKIRIFEG